MSLLARIRFALTLFEVDQLEKELNSYTQIANKTFKKAVRAIAKRRSELSTPSAKENRS